MQSPRLENGLSAQLRTTTEPFSQGRSPSSGPEPQRASGSVRAGMAGHCKLNGRCACLRGGIIRRQAVRLPAAGASRILKQAGVWEAHQRWDVEDAGRLEPGMNRARWERQGGDAEDVTRWSELRNCSNSGSMHWETSTPRAASEVSRRPAGEKVSDVGAQAPQHRSSTSPPNGAP